MWRGRTSSVAPRTSRKPGSTGANQISSYGIRNDRKFVQSNPKFCETWISPRIRRLDAFSFLSVLQLFLFTVIKKIITQWAVNSKPNQEVSTRRSLLKLSFPLYKCHRRWNCMQWLGSRHVTKEDERWTNKKIENTNKNNPIRQN